MNMFAVLTATCLKGGPNSNAVYFQALLVVPYFQIFCTLSVAHILRLGSPVSLLLWLASVLLLFCLSSVPQS